MVDPGQEEQIFFRQFWRHGKTTTHKACRWIPPPINLLPPSSLPSSSMPALTRLRAALEADLDYNDRMARLGATQADVAYSQAIWVVGTGIAVAALLAVAAAAWLNRTVIFRLCCARSGAMRQLAKRDYGFELPCVTRTDEIGDHGACASTNAAAA